MTFRIKTLNAISHSGLARLPKEDFEISAEVEDPDALLLRSANLTVTEVCMMVGFSSLGSFSSRFHELTGETPTQYRDRFARDGAPREKFVDIESMIRARE